MKEPALLLHCRRADLEERYKLLGLLYICIEEDYGKFWGKERAYKFTHSTILHECMDRNIATTYVAESYNGLLAFAVTTAAEILYLVVLPQFRDKGIGRRLLSFVEGTMLLTTHRLEARINKLNRSGLELFLSNGWKMVTYKETDEEVTLALERRHF
ncbi:Acetyltransferase (GNAT) domain-containing protein [Giardia duodenalis]|uniref:Acetyltransferase (GNAT) domain-containing protein n=1 Tax=Giardia intestinalis (strain ATCC 50803 / WB clone C6) TaxID=184922 RepID=A8BC46_GIAIC|nr:Acetyltransferase (GNAT) domain-containing protein [Giardia intestinalis]KAE8301437.1 Acetyltransferase (GNAT) domain-containing protein [Giardia intestinalis]|eukprot:XP_001707828.1 Hypothetical protein GL50803_11866 [Giardia lamblia ATCC 50803]